MNSIGNCGRVSAEILEEYLGSSSSRSSTNSSSKRSKIVNNINLDIFIIEHLTSVGRP